MRAFFEIPSRDEVGIGILPRHAAFSRILSPARRGRIPLRRRASRAPPIVVIVRAGVVPRIRIRLIHALALALALAFPCRAQLAPAAPATAVGPGGGAAVHGGEGEEAGVEPMQADGRGSQGSESEVRVERMSRGGEEAEEELGGGSHVGHGGEGLSSLCVSSPTSLL